MDARVLRETPRPGPRRGEEGFSFAELLVALTLSTMLIVGVLALFDANLRITRVQTDVAEMQQAQRVVQSDLVRWSRMVGRGGLPAGVLPSGVAVEMINNVPADTHIKPGDDTTPLVRQETDIVIVRGVLRTPLYQIRAGQFGDGVNEFTVDAGLTSGTVIVRNPTQEGIPQDLEALRAADQGGLPEAILLVSVLEDTTYAVVELDPTNTTVAADGSRVDLGFLIQGGSNTADYNLLSRGGAYDPNLRSVIYLGVLEEVRYYVRDVTFGGDTFPVLTLARVYPGTEVPYAGSAANWQIDVADNIYDLQVALGLDTDGDGLVADGNTTTGLTPDVDEWMFNHADDDPLDPVWAAGVPSYMRLTSLVRSDRPDQRYLAPLLLAIEDHSYGTSPLNSDAERRFRRRAVQSVVDLRNLG